MKLNKNQELTFKESDKNNNSIFLVVEVYLNGNYLDRCTLKKSNVKLPFNTTTELLLGINSSDDVVNDDLLYLKEYLKIDEIRDIYTKNLV